MAGAWTAPRLTVRVAPAASTRVSTRMPIATVTTTTTVTYTDAKRVPNWLAMIAMVPVLVAGPVMRKISAAPGLTPRATSAAAMGVLAEAQM